MAVAERLSPCVAGGTRRLCCGRRVAAVGDAKQYPFLPLGMGKLRLGLIRCVLSEPPSENEENFACTVNLGVTPHRAPPHVYPPSRRRRPGHRRGVWGRDPKFPSCLTNTMMEKHKKQTLSPPVWHKFPAHLAASGQPPLYCKSNFKIRRKT